MTQTDACERDILNRRRVLIVEDEFLIAEDMALAIRDLGGEVVGPVPDVAEALEVIGRGEMDVAVLDINLGGELVFPAAQQLRDRGIPFVFATGYSGSHMPLGPFAAVPCWRKPYNVRALASMLVQVMEP